MVKKGKYQMRMSLNVLNHLGMNLYSNIPAVLSEVVANAYDADAEKVRISIGDDQITISDDGHGMTLSDINDKFLYVGYQRRENGEAFSAIKKRPVMGRKGIGKLSLFSIADEIEVHSVRKNPRTKKIEKCGFKLRKKDIIDQIKNSNDGVYYPIEIPSSKLKIVKGTKIFIRDLKKNINHTEAFLRKRLARRFSVISSSHKFSVLVNKIPITIKDRDFFSKIQLLWIIGDGGKEISGTFRFKKVNNLNGNINNKKGYVISGWIGAVEKAGDLDIDGVNNNKISIICRGKMAQEDILEAFNEGGIYATYLVGEITADFLDSDDDEDIATTSRQKINEEDTRYLELQTHIYKVLKDIQNAWSNLRKELAEKEAIDKAEEFNPVLKEWFESLKTDSRRKHAKRLFATIETMHFDPTDEREKKKELYKQGILAFEKLKLRDSLHELERISGADNLKLSSIFNDLSDIEANLYFDIASERVSVIKEFQRKLEANDKEKLLQKYLFDNLWLLNPSLERATSGTAAMEKRVEAEFKKAIATLTKEEREGRLDIKYRTAAGKHIVVELKRYSPSYSIDRFALGKQAKKYRDALQKCLTTSGQENDAIEILIVLGKRISKDSKDQHEIDEGLKPYNARIIYYDQLIQDSLTSYSDYLDRQKEVSRLRAILEKL